MEEQQGNLVHEKEQISEETDDSESAHLKLINIVGNHLQENSRIHLFSVSEKWNNKEATLEHFFAISLQTISCTETVHDINGRQSDDPMEDLDVNVATWRIFMNATLKVAVHLGNDHDVNLRHVKNFLFEDLQDNFSVRQKSWSVVGISLIDSKDSRWISTSLLHSRADQYANAKVYVFSDSVPCLGRKGHNPVESWKKQIQWYSETNYFSELNRIEGKPMEFEWKIFPGFTTAGLLEEIQKKWANYSVIQRISKTGLSSCQFSTTLNEMQKEMKNYVEKNQKSWRIRSKISSRSLVFPWTWVRKEVVHCGENNAKFPKIWSPNIPLYQCLGQRTIKMQRRRKDNNSLQRKYVKYSVAPRDGHLRQSAQSLRSSSGFD